MGYYGRGKNKIQDSYTASDIYNDYQQTIDTESIYDIPNNLYKTIINIYFKEVMSVLFDKSLPFRFPSVLGTFQIVKKKRFLNSKFSTSRYINWKDTLRYGKVIHYVNEHSDGFRYFFMWLRDSRVKNISKYKFVPTRSNKRKLAYYIKNRIRDYFEVD